MGDEMQAEHKKDDVIEYVDENSVCRRASRSAYVCCRDPKEERVWQHNRIDVHRRKQHSLYK